MSEKDVRVIRVGIAGLSADGGWAARSHLPAIAASAGYSLAGVVASSPESGARAAERYGIPRSFDFIEDLAGSDDIDLVVVAVRVPHHVELVSAAIRAGKPVLCEWPLAPTLAEAKELASAVRSAGTRAWIGLQARSDPSIRYIGELVARGAIGTVLSTSVVASGMSWGRSTSTRSSYLRERSNGATMLSIPFAHSIDALQQCLGDVVRFSAFEALREEHVTNRDNGSVVIATAPDQLVVQGELDDGAVFSAHYRGGRSAASNFSWQIEGTEGSLLIEGPTGHLQHGDVTIRGAIDGGAELVELPVPERLDLAPGFARDDPAHAVANAYARLHSDFVAGETTVPGFDDALRLHGLLSAIHASAESGRRLTIDR
ncbi:MAG: Gfo/Idh/MocA family oxidoreductase [Actinomycetota bacterium]